MQSAWNTFAVIVNAVTHEELGQKELVGRLVQQADTALPATVLYVIAPGLYSLFVDDGIPLPGWLRIHTPGDLKELLASVVIVVLAVIFLGYALMWDGVQDLLVPGISSAAVIAALVHFLWVSGAERARLLQHEIDEREVKRCGSLGQSLGGVRRTGREGSGRERRSRVLRASRSASSCAAPGRGSAPPTPPR